MTASYPCFYKERHAILLQAQPDEVCYIGQEGGPPQMTSIILQ